MLTLTHRPAQQTDIACLAELNRQLIQDEGHRNSMSLAELKQRMSGWLRGEYEAIIFEVEGAVVAYALYAHKPDHIYLRQFFVCRAFRRQGVGQVAIDILQSQIWPQQTPIRLEVLVANDRARRFWQTIGFSEYAVTMELPPADRQR